MSDVKRTQGPWLASRLFPIVEAPDGLVVAKCENGRGQYRVDGDQAFANARLIAAAPELLEALKRMRAITHQHISAACDAADDAIAKAEGRS